MAHTTMDAAMMITCTRRMHDFGTCSTLHRMPDIRAREITAMPARMTDQEVKAFLDKAGVDRPLNHWTGTAILQEIAGYFRLR